ncbi:RIKEN cDNA C230030N03, partial [Mus musculus]
MLGVVHFLRSFFKTPEPGVPPPGEEECEDNQLHPGPADSEEQETNPEDLETLSHKSESRSGSDTKTDPFESASEAESLPGDLTGGVGLSEREAGWGCPEDSTVRLPQGRHLVCDEGLHTEEEPDLPSGLKAGSQLSKLHMLTAGRRDEACPCSRVASFVQESVPASVCFSKHASSNSSPHLQQARSRGYLDAPVVCPCFRRHCELGQSWPQIHIRTAAAKIPPTGSQHNDFPLWIRTKKGPAPRSTVGTDLFWVHPFLDIACQPRLGTPYLLDTKCHQSTPENLGANAKPPQGYLCWQVKTLVRAHSIASFPLGCPKEPLKQKGTNWPYLREGTEIEPDHPILHKTQSPGPTQLSRLLPTSQSRAPPLQGECKLSDCSFKRASPDTPCVGLPLENQVEQASRSCPAPSHLTSELLKLNSQEEVPRPAECKPGHSPESRLEEPKGVHPDDVISKQQCLLNISGEAGSQTENYPSMSALQEERKPPDRASLFPQHCCHGEVPVCNRMLAGSWEEESDSACAPRTALKSSVIGSLEAAEEGVVLDLQRNGKALQSLLDFPTLEVSHRNPGSECAQGPGDDPEPSPSGQRQAPGAHGASRHSCKFIMIAVKQEGRQTSTRKAHCLIEPQCGHLPEKGTSATAYESSRASEMPVFGNECELLGCPGAEVDGGALQLLAQGIEHVRVPVSRTSSDDTLSSEETLEGELLGERLDLGSECVHTEQNQELPSSDRKRGRCGTGDAENAEICACAGEVEGPLSRVLASSTTTLEFQEPCGGFQQSVLESEQHPACLQMTPLRTDMPWSREMPGGDIPYSQALTSEDLNPVCPSPEERVPHSPCQGEPPLHHVHQSVSLETKSGVIQVGTSGDLSGEGPSPESYNIKRL